MQAPSEADANEDGLVYTKSLKNKFDYQRRMKKLPGRVLEKWDALNRMERKDRESRQREFIVDVMRVTDGVYDIPQINKYETIMHVKTDGVRGEWVGWAKYERDEGNVAMAALKGGRLDTRPHPDLPPDSDVEWPYNLQVKRKRQYDDNSTTANQSQRAKSEAAFDATLPFQETMQTALGSWSSERGGCGSGSSGHASAPTVPTISAKLEEANKKDLKDLDKVMEQATTSQTTVMEITIAYTIAATLCKLMHCCLTVVAFLILLTESEKPRL